MRSRHPSTLQGRRTGSLRVGRTKELTPTWGTGHHPWSSRMENIKERGESKRTKETIVKGVGTETLSKISLSTMSEGPCHPLSPRDTEATLFGQGPK